jgi:hypothetical protein
MMPRRWHVGWERKGPVTQIKASIIRKILIKRNKWLSHSGNGLRHSWKVDQTKTSLDHFEMEINQRTLQSWFWLAFLEVHLFLLLFVDTGTLSYYFSMVRRWVKFEQAWELTLLIATSLVSTVPNSSAGMRTISTKLVLTEAFLGFD